MPYAYVLALRRNTHGSPYMSLLNQGTHVLRLGVSPRPTPKGLSGLLLAWLGGCSTDDGAYFAKDRADTDGDVRHDRASGNRYETGEESVFNEVLATVFPGLFKAS